MIGKYKKTDTLKGSLGSLVRVILKVTLDELPAAGASVILINCYFEQGKKKQERNDKKNQ